MPTRSDVQDPKTKRVGSDWAAHSDKPPRSVFSNFKAEVSEVAKVSPEIIGDKRMLSPLPEAGGKGAACSLQAAIDRAVARSFVYRFAAKCFENPTSDGWAILTGPTTQTTFRAAISALSSARPMLAASAEKLLAALTPSGLEAFNDSFLVVFGHAARGPCPMNEIEYGTLKADSLFQPHRLADLNAFYRAFGLDVAEDAGERPDHVCLELEFMSVLAAKEAYALEHQLDADQLAVVRDALKKFLQEHLGHWLPAFTRRLESEAGHGALTTLAEFTREFILSECARFKVAPGSEDLLLRPVDEAAERMCDSCGLANMPPGALTAA